MAYPQTMLSFAGRNPRRGLIFAIVALWGLVAVCLFTTVLSEFGFGDRSSKYYLLPWCMATGAVIAGPSIYLFYKGRFEPFHPLVFPAWSYFFPAFFVGGLLVAAGLSQPYFLSYVQDETYNLPLTLVYVMLGYGGLALGFWLPYGRKFGRWLGGWFPEWEIPTEKMAIPGLILLGIGFASTFNAFVSGTLGFQRIEQIGAFDGAISLLSLFLMQASFFLWLYVFRSDRFGIRQFLVTAVLLATGLTLAAFHGNRGGAIGVLIVVAFAYCSSGRRLTGKHYVVGAVLVFVALIGGMIYGTTFRSVKGSQEQVSVSQNALFVSDTFDTLLDQDPGSILVNGFTALAERIDSVSPLAVVVSNYEVLAPYEEIWGINNNIYVDTVTFFIPRMIWPAKPVSIDPSKYGDLYFNYSENSFTITPMGDLLRNFGPIGVPLGMIVLGIVLRILYASLIEGWKFQFWKATLFFMIFTNAISFEGVYSLIIPMIFKVAVVAVLGIIMVRFFAGIMKKAF